MSIVNLFTNKWYKTILLIIPVSVPAKITTPPGWTLTTKVGSDVTLPCAALGHPRPSIAWYKPKRSFQYRQKRWMATDRPFKLFNVQSSDSGAYNCTAVNGYGSDWNIVTLVVQGN